MVTKSQGARSRRKAGGSTEVAKSTNEAFRSAVITARKAAGLSQLELARLAGVSPKTIVQVEESGRARFDAIVRLAVALAKSPEDWLKLAGHSVSESRIKEVIEQRGPDRARQPFGRIDPVQFFSEMVSRVQKHGSALMCSCVMSNIRFDNKELFKITEDLFRAGLRLALVSPFSVTGNDIILKKPGLNRYYTRSYGWACDLGRQLQDSFPFARKQIHVFTPAQSSLVYTPIRMDEIRPALTKYSEILPNEAESEVRVPARYELGAYVRFGDGKADRWIEIHDGNGPPTERVSEDFDAWYDYFSDIFSSWSPTEEGSDFDLSKLGYWQLAPDRQ